MSGHSIISLIIFLSLIVFAVTGSILAMLISVCIIFAIWYIQHHRKPSPHFQKLAKANADYSDIDFHTANNLPRTQSTALLQSLRQQMPRSTRTIPLRPENHLFEDLKLDPVTLELDAMPQLCKTLDLDYTIDASTPLWDQIKTIQDLIDYITSRK